MKILNTKGSTLAFTLIVIAILSLLGVTLLSTTMAGYILRVNESNQKKAFYIAEGGLEQANAIIEQAMEDGAEYARNQADIQLSTFLYGINSGALGEQTIQDSAREDGTRNYESKMADFSPYFYQRGYQLGPAVTRDAKGNVTSTYDGSGNLLYQFEYDYKNNLTAILDKHGDPITTNAIMKINPATGLLVPLDSTDINPKLDGLVTSLVNAKRNEFYAAAYVSYIKDGVGDPASLSLIEKLDTVATFNGVGYIDVGDQLRDAAITSVIDFGALVPDGTGAYPQTMSMVFQSTARAQASGGATGSDKTLETTFEIGIPPYDEPSLLGDEIVKLKNNALFSKALLSEKNIIVAASDVTVNGNIYARGSDEAMTKNTDYYRMGGIVVGDADSLPTLSNAEKEGGLTVNGEVSTAGYLETRNSNSTITVNGNVFCNSLVTQQDWESDPDGVFSDVDVTINKDLNILDNLNMNCTDSRVLVKGSFFGFSSGSGSSTLHNNSSSIAINDTNIGSGGNTSRLTLEGGGDGNQYNVNGVTKTLAHGTYIAGTVHVNYGLNIDITTDPLHGTVTLNGDGGWTYKRSTLAIHDNIADSFVFTIENATFGGTEIRTINVLATEDELSGLISSNYMTGDSISVAGNFLAYTQQFTPKMVMAALGLTITPTPPPTGTPMPTEPDDATIMANAQVQQYDRFIDIPEVNFEYVPPLSMALGDKSGTLMNVDDRSKYARLARKYEKQATDASEKYFNFGAQKIQMQNVRFALGNFIETNAGVSDFQTMTDEMTNDATNADIGLTNFATYSEALKYKETEYKYHVNRLSNPQLNDIYYHPADADLDTPYGIADFFDYPATGGISTANVSGSPYTMENPLYYVSGTTEATPKDFILTGLGSTISPSSLSSNYNDVTLTSTDLRGIIVCRGDVYISGRVNFQGMIFAEGNIYIIDGNKKTFTNDFNPNLMTFDNTKIPLGSYDHLIASISNNLVVRKIMEDRLTSSTAAIQMGDYFKQNALWPEDLVYTKESNAEILSNSEAKTFEKRIDRFIQVRQWKKVN